VANVWTISIRIWFYDTGDDVAVLIH